MYETNERESIGGDICENFSQPCEFRYSPSLFLPPFPLRLNSQFLPFQVGINSKMNASLANRSANRNYSGNARVAIGARAISIPAAFHENSISNKRGSKDAERSLPPPLFFLFAWLTILLSLLLLFSTPRANLSQLTAQPFFNQFSKQLSFDSYCAMKSAITFFPAQ